MLENYVVPLSRSIVSMAADPKTGMRVNSHADALAVANDLTLAPNLKRFFGDLRETKVTDFHAHGRSTAQGLDLERVWQIEWSFTKEGVATRDTFAYSISVFVTEGMLLATVLESVRVKVETFIRHEVAEGLTVGGRRIFDPHSVQP